MFHKYSETCGAQLFQPPFILIHLNKIQFQPNYLQSVVLEGSARFLPALLL